MSRAAINAPSEDPMRERRLWAHIWIALYRPRVQWGGPYPYTAVMAKGY